MINEEIYKNEYGEFNIIQVIAVGFIVFIVGGLVFVVISYFFKLTFKRSNQYSDHFY